MDCDGAQGVKDANDAPLLRGFRATAPMLTSWISEPMLTEGGAGWRRGWFWMSELTQWLSAARSGDRAAIEQICAATYAELHALAHSRIMRSGRLTLLDTTSLVHETFLRLLNARRLSLDDRLHFLAYAAKVMRSVIVDYARQRASARRGGDEARVAIQSDVPDRGVAGAEEIIRVSDALEELRQLDERMVSIIEMRYFAGLTFEEVAASLELSERTVRREWEKARALLYTSLSAS